MIVVLILFVIPVAVYAAARVIINLLANRWAELPDFRYNYVGGGWAICGDADHEKAKKRNPFLCWSYSFCNFVIVPETIVFRAASAKLPMPQFFSGQPVSETDTVSGLGESGSRQVPSEWRSAGLTHRKYTPDLFVPFISERFTSQSHQADFAKRKREENLKADWRRRFAKWMKAGKLDDVPFWSGIASILMLIVLLLATLVWIGKRSDKEPVTIHLTTPGEIAVQEIKTTKGDAHRLPINEDYLDRLVIKGRVSEILPVGGDLMQVCVAHPDSHHTDCGLAASSLGLRVGDTAYIRKAHLKMWSDNDPRGTPYRFEVGRWVVSEGEAKALAATGKFTIEDK